MSLSLVAELDGQVVGHIAFSSIAISDGARDWYRLGPVSLLPADQRRSIGKALIERVLAHLKALGARGCCLVGHPENYRKFGYKNVPGLVQEGVPPEVFFALAFDGRYPSGRVSFHAGFMAASL